MLMSMSTVNIRKLPKINVIQMWINVNSQCLKTVNVKVIMLKCHFLPYVYS